MDKKRKFESPENFTISRKELKFALDEWKNGLSERTSEVKQEKELLKEYSVKDSAAQALEDDKDKSFCFNIIKFIIEHYTDSLNYIQSQKEKNYLLSFDIDPKKNIEFDLEIMNKMVSQFPSLINNIILQINKQDNTIRLDLDIQKNSYEKEAKLKISHLVNKDFLTETIKITKQSLTSDEEFKKLLPPTTEEDLTKINMIIKDVYNIDKFMPKLSTKLCITEKLGIKLWEIKFTGLESIQFSFIRFILEKYKNILSSIYVKYHEGNYVVTFTVVPNGFNVK